MPSKKKEPDYLKMSEQEIDLFIGEALLKDSMGSAPVSDTEKQIAAQNWFEANLHRFAKAVCEKKGAMNSLIGPEKKERNSLLGAVADVLLKVLGPSGIVPVAALAAKLLHYGIDQLCSEKPQEK
ncbi:MAG: hypothetical protein ABIN01_10550 [Ferruginibacter sp.]